MSTPSVQSEQPPLLLNPSLQPDLSMSSGTVHLLVLIHGMWGKPDHLAEMRRVFDETYCQSDSKFGPDGERLHILVAQTNRESSTYDGIDWGGERVAEEVCFSAMVQGCILAAPMLMQETSPSSTRLAGYR